MSNLDIALYWASLGVPVLRLAYLVECPDGRLECSCGRPESKKHKSGKHPLLEGSTEATTDRDRIRRWWRACPEAQVGLVCGHGFADTGRFLLVLDLDSHDARRLWEQAGCPEPTTFTVRTGRPGYGRHVYLLTTVPMSNSKGDIPLLGVGDVDVRGLGMYVVAPGMRHVSGRRYEPSDEWLRIEAAPGEVQRLLIPAEDKSSSGRRRHIEKSDPDRVALIAKEQLTRLADADIPPRTKHLLDADPPDGQRSEAAFAAFLALARLTDYDELVAGTILASNVGRRYVERIAGNRDAGRRFLFDEIDRAREWVAQDKGASRRKRFVERICDAASRELQPQCGTCMRVLYGYLCLAADRAVPEFAAAQSDVAIAAGVHSKTVAFHLRSHLVPWGWIEIVRDPGIGSLHARTYRLGHPVAPCSQGFSTRSLSGGDVVTQGQPLLLSARQQDCAENGQSMDLSADGWRWGAGNRLWETLRYLTHESDMRIPDLMQRTGKQRQAVKRALRRASEEGLIADRDPRTGYRLHSDIKARLEALAARRGTAGRKQRAQDQLERERLYRRPYLNQLDRERRRRRSTVAISRS